MPKNAIYSCNTYTDGPVYIGGFDNIPGKVNLENNKIWNIWVQDLGSRQVGEILVMNTTYKWKEISRGDTIPSNALYCGLDNHGDKVWVGRSTGECLEKLIVSLMTHRILQCVIYGYMNRYCLLKKHIFW